MKCQNLISGENVAGWKLYSHRCSSYWSSTIYIIINYLRNRFWHFMQIVSDRDNLHEYVKKLKIRNIPSISSAVFLPLSVTKKKKKKTEKKKNNKKKQQHGIQLLDKAVTGVRTEVSDPSPFQQFPEEPIVINSTGKLNIIVSRLNMSPSTG